MTQPWRNRFWRCSAESTSKRSSSPSDVYKRQRSARQFDLKWCRNAVALAAETDLAMKSTGIDREELLTDLLLKLAAG